MNIQLSTEEIKEKLRDIISEDLDANIVRGEIRDDISLYEDGLGLDSISVVNLIVLVEKKFDFNFSEEDINYELFKSLNHLTEVVHRKLK
jgi:acyl carrier protein